MEDAQKLLKIPKSEFPDVWIRLPKHSWPKSWKYIEDPVVPLERNSYGHPLAGLLWERQFEKALMELGWEKVPNWECFIRSQKTNIILVGLCGWHQNGGKEAECSSYVGNWWKMLILRSQHHFLTTFTLDGLNGIAKQTRKLSDNTTRCLNLIFLRD